MTPKLLRLANAKSKGKRPFFFTNPESERVLNITMALAQETAVLRERVDTLERLLERCGLLSQAEIDSYQPSALAAVERGAWQQEFLARILRIVQQEIDALDERHAAATAEELSEEVLTPEGNNDE